MATAKYSSSYRKPGGRLMYVYIFNGTAKELEDYKATAGTNYREDDNGNALIFLSATLPNGGFRIMQPSYNLTKTGGANPRYVVDEAPAQFAFAAQVNQHLAIETAKAMAQQMVNPVNNQVTMTQPVTQTTATPVVATTEAGAVAELEAAPAATEELG